MMIFHEYPLIQYYWNWELQNEWQWNRLGIFYRGERK